MDRDSPFLGSHQLFEIYSKRCPKPVYVPKKNLNSQPLAEDDKYLQEKYNELEDMLSHQRVVKHGNVSLAEYSNGDIVVKQKVGKWEKFGFSVRNEQHLYPHEALFLVEIKRLMVTHEALVLSLEECYKMFLTETTSDDHLTLPEYLVYATLTRSGLFLRLHVPIKIPLTEEELIWNHLDELLANPTRREPPNIPSPPIVIQQMERSRSFIEGHLKSDQSMVPEETSFEWPTKKAIKRKSSSWAQTAQGSVKRLKRNPKESKLDVLKMLPEYEQMRSIFEELQITRVRTFPVRSDFHSSFQIKFDIFNPKSKHDKKATIPSYRGIVCSSNRSPEYQDLIYLQQDLDPTPILVFHVDESMMIHGFLYEFE